jgi:hypothetical protein
MFAMVVPFVSLTENDLPDSERGNWPFTYSLYVFATEILTAIDIFSEYDEYVLYHASDK